MKPIPKGPKGHQSQALQRQQPLSWYRRSPRARLLRANLPEGEVGLADGNCGMVISLGHTDSMEVFNREIYIYIICKDIKTWYIYIYIIHTHTIVLTCFPSPKMNSIRIILSITKLEAAGSWGWRIRLPATGHWISTYTALSQCSGYTGRHGTLVLAGNNRKRPCGEKWWLHWKWTLGIKELSARFRECARSEKLGG